MNLRQNQKGFTIVELLIVVVVIAILAAISIVAYTGITNRANSSAAIEAANSVKSVAVAYPIFDTPAMHANPRHQEPISGRRPAQRPNTGAIEVGWAGDAPAAVRHQRCDASAASPAPAALSRTSSTEDTRSSARTYCATSTRTEQAAASARIRGTYARPGNRSGAKNPSAANTSRLPTTWVTTVSGPPAGRESRS